MTEPLATAHRASTTLLVLALALVLLPVNGPEPAAARGFSPVDATGLQGLKLYDLGVADANGDGDLDLFTTNHKFDSSLLLGDGEGGLVESRVALGLSPTQAFPGFEDLRRDPLTSEPGLYLYATDRDQPRDPFHIDTTAIAASGRLVFGAQDLQVESVSGATVSTSRLPDGSSALDFDAAPGAAIDVSVEHIDLPIAVRVDQPTDPSLIRVGADAVPATSRDLVLSLRDRHGLGFADFDGDRLTDVFITTGGLGGEILDPFFSGRQSDELLLARSGAFVNATATSGLVKGTCRGRGVDIADFDGDGALDLLEACELSNPQLYSGDGAGHFAQVAAPPALGSTLRALDLLGDRRAEVVATNGDLVQVWRSVDGGWSLAQQVRSLNGDAPVQHLTLGDYDNDGDLDLFAVARGGNTMLANVDGRLRRRSPRDLGLPERGGFAASFVDFDNDGDLDLDVIPQGLFESRKGHFRRTGKLAYGPLPTGRIGYGISSWPDLDEDGRRDPISARGRGEFPAEQFVEVRRNTTDAGHWLQVDLAGPRGNTQAIGASVRVQTADVSSYGWVGQSDDSRYSSGHYRLYFGLGNDRRIERVTVTWPDGKRQTLRSPRADRVLRVEYPKRESRNK